MSILRWDKPKKVMTTQQWAEHAGFEDGPTGGYSPNMSEADQLSWKAKITGTKLGFPQVEIRKTTERGSQVVIIVNLGAGYNYKYYRTENEDYKKYADVADYIEQQALYYFTRYPGQYSSVQDVKDTLLSPPPAERDFQRNKYPTKGINVHMATNGPIQMTFEEMQDMQKAVDEAKLALESLAAGQSKKEVVEKNA